MGAHSREIEIGVVSAPHDTAVPSLSHGALFTPHSSSLDCQYITRMSETPIPLRSRSHKDGPLLAIEPEWFAHTTDAHCTIIVAMDAVAA